jgi:membrane protein DedA with SNARE-associated domain
MAGFEPLGLALVALVLLVKELGIPIPVPGDLIVVGAGAAASHGSAGPVALVAIIGAATAGGTAQFLLVRGAARRPVISLLGRLGIPEERIARRAALLRQGGAGAVALARATPGVRVVAIAASGLAALPFRAFLGGLVLGNTAFIGFHFALGFLAGDAALGLVSAAGPIALAVGALALAGVAGWWMLARRRSARGLAAQPVETLLAWADAACPACLGLALLYTEGTASEA